MAVLAVSGIVVGCIALMAIANPPVTSLMLIRRAQGYGMERQWRDFQAMAPALREAAIAGEDLNFCGERWGFDTGAIAHQLSVWREGGSPAGASTITMQLARNLFLWPGRFWFRKVAEAALTVPLALLWTKQRQIEVYLNVAEFGPGVYGVEAAARQAFGVAAMSVTPAQAAALIAVLPAPLTRSANAPTPAMADKARFIAALIDRKDPRLACAD